MSPTAGNHRTGANISTMYLLRLWHDRQACLYESRDIIEPKFIDQAKWVGASRRKYSFCMREERNGKSSESRTSLSKLTRREASRAAFFFLYPLSNNAEVSVKCGIIESQDEKYIRETTGREAYSIAACSNGSSQIRYACNIAGLALHRFDLTFYKICYTISLSDAVANI